MGDVNVPEPVFVGPVFAVNVMPALVIHPQDVLLFRLARGVAVDRDLPAVVSGVAVVADVVGEATENWKA
jgi:hypothetical protein